MKTFVTIIVTLKNVIHKLIKIIIIPLKFIYKISKKIIFRPLNTLYIKIQIFMTKKFQKLNYNLKNTKKLKKS